LVFNRTYAQPVLERELRIGERAMSLEALIVLIIVGAIAGWLAGQIVKDDRRRGPAVHHRPGKKGLIPPVARRLSYRDRSSRADSPAEP
jgi:hypothetical protein